MRRQKTADQIKYFMIPKGKNKRLLVLGLAVVFAYLFAAAPAGSMADAVWAAEMPSEEVTFTDAPAAIPEADTAMPEDAAGPGQEHATSPRDLSWHVSVGRGTGVPGKGFRRFARMPAAYDARCEDWYASVALRDQEETGLCWAFSAATAAQIAAAKEFGYDQVLSPLQLGYFLWHRPADPLGLTAGDENAILATTDYLQIGGNHWYTMQAMAGWIGCGRESVLPFVWRDRALPSNLCWENDITLEHADLLEAQDEIKQAILEHGCALAEVDTEHAMIGEHAAVYNDYSYAPDHAVTIIGWDDSFSREHFNASMRPSADGAWIIQDSRGPDAWEDGYYYLSYDEILYDPMALDMQPGDRYDLNFQYDGNAADDSMLLDAGERAVNFFTVPADAEQVRLQAAAFTTLTWEDTDLATASSNAWDQRSYRIEIYIGCQRPEDLAGAVPAAAVEATFDNPGFHTLPLEEALTLPAGVSFAVAVTPLTQPVLLGIERDHRIPGLIHFRSHLERGQSFLETDSWEDLAVSADRHPACCARIKALASGSVQQADDTRRRPSGPQDEPVAPHTPEAAGTRGPADAGQDAGFSGGRTQDFPDSSPADTGRGRFADTGDFSALAGAVCLFVLSWLTMVLTILLRGIRNRKNYH